MIENDRQRYLYSDKNTNHEILEILNILLKNFKKIVVKNLY